MLRSAYRAVLALAAVAVVSACAGQQPAMNSIPNTATKAATPSHRASWMKPQPAGQALLYVSDFFGHAVDVFTYPGLSSAGQLTGFQNPTGECTDTAGNVWIADEGSGAIYEYAHGGTTPIHTQTGMFHPQGCAINPKTGDLAVANGNVEVFVFSGGTGSPTVYRDFNFNQTSSLGYDNHGNLFVDGLDTIGNFHYAKLPKGAEAFTDITLNGFPVIQSAGDVQWDGTYMAVGDGVDYIYRVDSSNNVVGATLLTNAQCNTSFYIKPRKFIGSWVVAPDQCGQNLVGVYAYPAGGSPSKSIQSGLVAPWGVAVSR